MAPEPDHRPLVVLDDDPTGTQAVAGVPVVFAWTDEALAEAAAARPRAVHVLTNSRAVPGERAREIVREAASAARAALPGARLALRGDSTLRAHLVEEYLGLCAGAFAGRRPPLLLVPALPAAGRVTVGGVHLVEREGGRVPLHETEYARDGGFAYRDARLLAWAEERSGGLLAARDGREVPLAELRGRGPAAVAEALAALAAAGRPAACAPDAETVADLEAIAEGLRSAEADGVEVAVRCAPTFAGVLGGTLAQGYAPVPRAPRGVVVVCGSHVPTTTRQLGRLAAARPGCIVEADLAALAGPDPEPELARLAREASARLARLRLAVVATPRGVDERLRDLATGERIARTLARVLQRVEPRPDVVAAKGGITSAVTAVEGLGARSAEVAGPLVDGVALWRASGRAGTMPYVVFPGNVGGDELLADVVGRILAA